MTPTLQKNQRTCVKQETWAETMRTSVKYFNLSCKKIIFNHPQIEIKEEPNKKINN